MFSKPSNVNRSEMHKGVYNDPAITASNVGKKGSGTSEYVEEESYMNPNHLDSQSDIDFEDEKLRSINGQGMIL